ncbi:Crp/Fnr family transcriptional regulator [Methylorubrum sp. SB2]|uniref:Crp/Fnr family transcriptional regulator n=1 Tax=Methylorubrum subtropicum TaxID=3138812 RepID=UPI00313C0F67
MEPDGADRPRPGSATGSSTARWRQHILLQSLDEATAQVLQGELRPATLSVGEVLFESGQMLDRIWLVESRLVSLVTLLQGGRESDGITVGRHGALGLPATLGSGHVISRAVVLVEGTAWELSGAACQAAMRRDETFGHRIMRYYEAIFAAAVQLTACNASHSLEQRFCRWLLTCRDQLDSDVLPVRQEAFSRMLGVNRTSVVAISRTLQAEGTILMRHGRITVMSRDRLSHRACECYATMRARFRHIR